MNPHVSRALILLMPLVIAACSTAQHGQGNARPGSDAGGGRPVAALRGSLLTWNDLHPGLAEAAGAAALEEAVLDRVLAERAAQLAITVDDRSVDAEKQALSHAVETEAAMSADQAATQLERLRRVRGLGPARFDALLLRNARLRAIVRAESPADVTPSPEQIEQEDRIANGERCRVRVFFTPSQATCSRVRDAVLGERSGTPTGTDAALLTSARFADAAVRESSDPSARAGGLLDAVSPSDPAVPEAIRRSLGTLQPGEVSPVLVAGNGFALVLMESRFPAGRTVGREELEQRLRTKLERLAMERLAREAVATSGVSVLDPSLAWSWESR